MGNNKSGKISPIVKEYGTDFLTQEGSLAKAGYCRTPGTSRILLPFKENGKYRTGLDENAEYLYRMFPDKEARDAETKRIKEDRIRLERITGLDLSPITKKDSNGHDIPCYYNFGADLPEDRRVTPVKLGTQDRFFNFNDPIEEITWNWVKVNPQIAPSYEAYQRGDVHPAHVQYYVSDEDVESKLLYDKKQTVNKAIADLEVMSPEKRKQVGRLMGLPISENTKEKQVYILMDSTLKEGEFKTGEHKGLSTIKMFNDLASLKTDRLHVKDLVGQAMKHSIYRIGAGGKIYEGGNKVAETPQELTEWLLDDKNQEDLLALEKKLNIKKQLV